VAGDSQTELHPGQRWAEIVTGICWIALKTLLIIFFGHTLIGINPGNLIYGIGESVVRADTAFLSVAAHVQTLKSLVHAYRHLGRVVEGLVKLAKYERVDNPELLMLRVERIRPSDIMTNPFAGRASRSQLPV
jgi:hypothetical protein